MKYVFLVESPLQLLNCSIYIKQKSIKNAHAIVFKSNNKENLKQLRRVASNFRERWKSIDFTRKSINTYSKNYNHTEHVVGIGDLRSPWMSISVKKSTSKKILLIDDGTCSLFYDTNIEKIKKLELKHREIKAITIYNKEMPIKKSKIDYSELKNKKTHKNIKTIFIGSGINFKSMLDTKKYINFIVQENKLNNLLYFPHRAEPKNFTRLINRKYNIKTFNPKMPIELWYSKQNHSFKRIIGFSSACFYSMPLIDQSIEFICYRDRETESTLSKTFEPWGYPKGTKYNFLMDVYFKNLNKEVQIIYI